VGAAADYPKSGDRIVIQTIEKGGPGARAGLRKGDVIVALGGTPVGVEERKRGVRKDYANLVAMGEAIDAAEGKDGRLVMSVERDGKGREVVVKLRPVGAFAKTFPRGCGKATALRRAACDRMVELLDRRAMARHDGELKRRHIYALVGLALLAEPGQRHDTTLEELRYFLAGPDDKAHIPDDFLKPNGLDNWALVSVATFLSEYRIARKDESLDPVIRRHYDALLKRVRESGVQGHSADVLDDPHANDYGGIGINIISTQMHWALAYGPRLGIRRMKVPFDRSMKHVLSSINTKAGGDNGAVAYVKGNHSGWDSAGRTAALLLALKIEGIHPEQRKAMASYLIRQHWRTLDIHANSVYGPCWVPGALNAQDPKLYRQWLDAWRWWFALGRGRQGHALYVGGRGNVGGDGYIGFDMCAQLMTALALAPATGRLVAFGS